MAIKDYKAFQEPLVENNLYPAGNKDTFVKDKTSVADAFFFNFFGIIGLYSLFTGKSHIPHYFKADGKIQLTNIGDTNNDISLSVLLYHEIGGITAASAANLTRFLAKIKNTGIEKKDWNESFIKNWMNDILYTSHRPSPKVFDVIDQFANGKITLAGLTKKLYMLAKLPEFEAITKDFRTLCVPIASTIRGINDISADNLHQPQKPSVASDKPVTQPAPKVDKKDKKPTAPILDLDWAKKLWNVASLSDFDKMYNESLVVDQNIFIGVFWKFYDANTKEFKIDDPLTWNGAFGSKMYGLIGSSFVKKIFQTQIKEFGWKYATKNLAFTYFKQISRGFSLDDKVQLKTEIGKYFKEKIKDISVTEANVKEIKAEIFETKNYLNALGLYGNDYDNEMIPKRYSADYTLKQLIFFCEIHAAGTFVRDWVIHNVGSAFKEDSFGYHIDLKIVKAFSAQAAQELEAAKDILSKYAIDFGDKDLVELMIKQWAANGSYDFTYKIINRLDEINQADHQRLRDAIIAQAIDPSTPESAAYDIIRRIIFEVPSGSIPKAFLAGFKTSEIRQLIEKSTEKVKEKIRYMIRNGQITQEILRIKPIADIMETYDVSLVWDIMMNGGYTYSIVENFWQMADVMLTAVIWNHDDVEKFITKPDTIFDIITKTSNAVALFKFTGMSQNFEEKICSTMVDFLEKDTNKQIRNSTYCYRLFARWFDKLTAPTKERVLAYMEKQDTQYMTTFIKEVNLDGMNAALVSRVGYHLTLPQLEEVVTLKLAGNNNTPERKALFKDLADKALDRDSLPHELKSKIKLASIYGRHNVVENVARKIQTSDHRLISTILETCENVETIKALSAEALINLSTHIEEWEKKKNGVSPEARSSLRNQLSAALTSLAKYDLAKAERVYDSMERNNKKDVITYLLAYDFVDKAMAEVYGETALIKPHQKLDHERLMEVLKYNNIKLPSLRTNSKEAKTMASVMLQRATLAKDPINKLHIDQVDLDTDMLEKMAVEYHKFNNGRHGDIAVKFIRSFNTNIPMQETGFAEWCKTHQDQRIIKPAFHGTGSIGASMILRYGFAVLSANDKLCVGRMLGDGIYFSTVLDKVSQYIGDTGFGRGLGTKGYILEMEAALGSQGTDFRAAGVEGNRDGIRSPEWCVFTPNSQLRIYKAHEVELVKTADIQALVDKHAPKIAESSVFTIEAFKQSFINEADVMNGKNVIQYIFMDGSIPISEDEAIPFEEFQKLGNKNCRVDISGMGPVLVFNRVSETKINVVRYTNEFQNDTNELGLFLELLNAE